MTWLCDWPAQGDVRFGIVGQIWKPLVILVIRGTRLWSWSDCVAFHWENYNYHMKGQNVSELKLFNVKKPNERQCKAKAREVCILHTLLLIWFSHHSIIVVYLPPTVASFGLLPFHSDAWIIPLQPGKNYKKRLIIALFFIDSLICIWYDDIRYSLRRDCVHAWVSSGYSVSTQKQAP